jgi:hypothetical protein
LRFSETASEPGRLSGEALRDLQAAYPGLTFLSPGDKHALAKSGHQLRRDDVRLGGARLAYHGIPSIACARHPMRFRLLSDRAVQEFLPRVLAHAKVLRSPEADARTALEFYYMRNLHGESDDLGTAGASTPGGRPAKESP